MRSFSLILASALTIGSWHSALAQFEATVAPNGIRLGQSKTQHWRCGTTVQALGGPCKGIVAYIPFPTEWPEQSLKIVGEDISREARVSYETVDNSVKLMVVKIAQLAGGQEAKAIVTFEMRRSVILAPTDTTIFRLPDKKKLDRKLLQYLAPSPKIESDNPKIKGLAREILPEQEAAWQKVEAVYDWVRAHVKYKNGPLKGAMAALKDGDGDCEDMSALFIAICRAGEIPARTVWVPGHCYPEFYLFDDKGEGHWFPCQASGSAAFGEIPELRPILQKGDNFRPPWNKREHQRYLAEFLTGTPSSNGGKPQVRFIRELVPE